MERFAWMGRIKPGMEAEYKRRHDEIWPEMVELLKSAGICNYTIWSDGDLLFGYYECEKGIEFAEKTQANSPIVDRWNEYMKDILELEMDPVTGAQPKLKKRFLMERKKRKRFILPLISARPAGGTSPHGWRTESFRCRKCTASPTAPA